MTPLEELYLAIIVTLALWPLWAIGEAVFAPSSRADESRPDSDVGRRSPGSQRGSAPRGEVQR